MNKLNSLRIGKSSDLKNFDSILYRFFEMLPGILSILILVLAVVFSFYIPLWVAFFIIIYDLYWLFRSIYFGFFLKTAYTKMKKNEKENWFSKIKTLKIENGLPAKSWEDVYHLIVLPTYTEPIEIIRNTLNCILETDYPKEKMILVLGFENRDKGNADTIAKQIRKEYEKSFFKFLITCHPDNLIGEIPGHASNGTWATKKAKQEIIDKLNIPFENIIVSSFDIDCCVPKKYFSILTYYYLTEKDPTKTSYQPIPLYLNNIWSTPPVSRVFSWSATFWQTMNQERPEKLITFSSHSMPFKALVDVGFKQPNVVSDDSRIFWQCFFEYNGNYKTKPMFYPVSMDANADKNFKKTLKNVYKQQKRWAYGVGEIPFFFYGAIKDKKIPLDIKFKKGFELLEGHITWATSSLLIFLLGWLPLYLGGEVFSQTLLAYNLPKITGVIMSFAMLGLIGSIYASMLLIPAPKVKVNKIRYVWMILEWALIPFIMIFFSALPALNAQAHWLFGKYLGFWVTPKNR